MAYNWDIRKISGKLTKIDENEIKELCWRTLASLLEDFEKTIDNISPEEKIDYDPNGKIFGPILANACLHATFDYYELEEMDNIAENTPEAEKKQPVLILWW